MERFLQCAKNAVNNTQNYDVIRVVLGNPTCDLDSAVCALVYGYSQYYDVKKNNNTKVAVIPIMNILEKEFRVKTEVVYYLKKHNISSDLLTFRDHVDLEGLHGENKLQLILVDHHALAEKDVTLADAVTEVIDHRPQDVSWLWTSKILNLETVGSCATLVAKSLLEKCPEIIDAQVSNLLRGPILIDTCNFSKEANRATPKDFRVIESLEEVGRITSDRSSVFKEILDAKTDISNLTPNDLLIRDLKVTNGVPIAGLPILVEDYVKLNGSLEAVKMFTRERGCPVTIIIGMDLTDEVVRRDIGIFSFGTNELEEKIAQTLTTSDQPKLELTVAKQVSEDGFKLVVYKQGNVRATRKQILPIIQSASVAYCRC